MEYKAQYRAKERADVGEFEEQRILRAKNGAISKLRGGLDEDWLKNTCRRQLTILAVVRRVPSDLCCASGQTTSIRDGQERKEGACGRERGVLLMRPVRSLVLSLGSTESLLMVKRYSPRHSASETHTDAVHLDD